jgi:hypothetical protein
MYSMESIGCEFFPSPVVCVGVLVLGGSSRVVGEEESLSSDVCIGAVDVCMVDICFCAEILNQCNVGVRS